MRHGLTLYLPFVLNIKLATESQLTWMKVMPLACPALVPECRDPRHYARKVNLTQSPLQSGKEYDADSRRPVALY